MARPGLRNHPKFRRLVHLLGEPAPHVLGYLECLWAVGYENGNPRLGDAIDVELAAEWPGEDGQLCRSLHSCGFVDMDDAGVYYIHDLLDHAPDYVRKRARREAERRARGGQCPPNGGHRPQNGSTPAPAPAPAPKEEGASAPSCSELPKTAASEPPVLTFPTVGHGPQEWRLMPQKLREYQEAFPGVDVLAECRIALQWCRDNPSKRKTYRGMPAFLTRWLTRVQNSGHYSHPKEAANGAGATVGRTGRLEAPRGKYDNVGTTVRTGQADPAQGAGGPLAGDQAAPRGGH